MHGKDPTTTCLWCETQCIHCRWHDSCDTALPWQASQTSRVCRLEGLLKANLHCTSVRSSCIVHDSASMFAQCQTFNTHALHMQAPRAMLVLTGARARLSLMSQFAVQCCAEASLALQVSLYKSKTHYGAPPMDLNKTKRAAEIRCQEKRISGLTDRLTDRAHL